MMSKRFRRDLDRFTQCLVKQNPGVAYRHGYQWNHPHSFVPFSSPSFLMTRPTIFASLAARVIRHPSLPPSKHIRNMVRSLIAQSYASRAEQSALLVVPSRLHRLCFTHSHWLNERISGLTQCAPARYRCGQACDGQSWHPAETSRGDLYGQCRPGWCWSEPSEAGRNSVRVSRRERGLEELILAQNTRLHGCDDNQQSLRFRDEGDYDGVTEHSAGAERADGGWWNGEHESGAVGDCFCYRMILIAINGSFLLPRHPPAFGHFETKDALVVDGLFDVYNEFPMGNCAEHTASKHSITRDEQDEHCLSSYTRAEESWKAGLFEDEVAPVAMKGRKGDTVVKEDEEYKRFFKDKYRSLKPVFAKENGTVTAANASTLNDGASAVVLASGEVVEKEGLKPLAKILGA